MRTAGRASEKGIRERVRSSSRLKTTGSTPVGVWTAAGPSGVPAGAAAPSAWASTIGRAAVSRRSRWWRGISGSPQNQPFQMRSSPHRLSSDAMSTTATTTV